MAVEKILGLADVCLAPTRQSRPTMKKCAEILWKIRKDFREKAPSSFSSPASASESHDPIGDAKKKSRHISFGNDEGDSYKFTSA